MTSPYKLAHVVYWTNQIEVMTRWYTTVLDAHVVFDSPKLVFLTYDDEHHRIALIHATNTVEQVERPRVGFYHVAFTYRSLMELLDNGGRLEAAGIRPWRVINHGFTISYYYRDPDGNDVELQVDRFADAADVDAYMESEAFRRNAVGCLVDPAELRRQLLAGVPEDQVMRREDE